jgi:hypothetical protein
VFCKLIIKNNAALSQIKLKVDSARFGVDLLKLFSLLLTVGQK